MDPHATVLPPFASPSQVSTRGWVIGAGGLATATCALVGLYPQFDEGNLRVLLALSSGLSGAFVMWVAMRISSRVAGAACAVGLSSIVGAFNTLVPAFILTIGRSSHRTDEFAFAVFLGLILGAATGFAYGLVLGALAALVQRPNGDRSLDGADRGKVRASLWCGCVALGVLAVGPQLKAPLATMVVAAVVAGGSVIGAVLHGLRWRARSAWTARVRNGDEPPLRVRALAAEDPPELPRLGEGRSVIEWAPTANEGVYRIAAAGVPLAVISDRAPLAR